MHRFVAVLAVALLSCPILGFNFGTNQTPADWRSEKRLIDLHLHVNSTEPHLRRAVSIMDSVGIGLGINLSGGTVTRRDGQVSELERNKTIADKLFPGRFLYYMNLDYAGFDGPGFSERAAAQIEEGFRLGAAGLKEYKRLGLYLRDSAKKLIRIDDPRLDAVWAKCAELGMPVSIHVGDPKAFWEPYNDQNERWTELKDHKSWWFGDGNVYPPRMELLEALNRVIEKHPKTTFVCVHFANNAEDLEWVERSLDRYPNMHADLAARIPEIGRHAPDSVRRLFEKHQDRILFATDFQVYDRLTLGSGGSGPAPTDDDARLFFEKHWRWLETSDRDFPHMTPIQGEWTISAIGLPNAILRKVYFDNARRLLAKFLPFQRAQSKRITANMAVSDLENPAWKKAFPFRLEYDSLQGAARPQSSTMIRSLHTGQHLYLRFDSAYTELTTFEPPRDTERVGLWDRDVVEAFIAPDPANIRTYYEFEVAPTNEKLDLILSPGGAKIEEALAWNSGFESYSRIDEAAKIWTCVMRIPISPMTKEKIENGTRWRVNFYRIDRAQQSFLASNPTLSRTFHAPDRFGWLDFVE